MSDLKYRKRYTNSINIEILTKFKAISEKTKIPASRLLDEALEDLIKKYEKDSK